MNISRLVKIDLSIVFCVICYLSLTTVFADPLPPAPTNLATPIVLSNSLESSINLLDSGSSPTPPTPPTIDLRSLIPKALSKLIIDGAVDLRYRKSTTGRSNSLYIQSLELDLQQPLIYRQVQQGSVFLQMIGENPPDIVNNNNGIEDFAIGEAYVSYRLPVMTDTDSTAYLRVGQFVLPVGLMATYDTHQEIIQTLYAEGIGERTDWGVALDGRFYGVLDYNLAITAGTGPGHISVFPDRVVSFRLGRLFLTPYGTFNLGGSLLGGRLPVTQVDPTTDFPPELPPSGKVTPQFGYEDKTRIIGDGQWTFRAVTARGEVMVGSDTNNAVEGAFEEGEYRFAPGLSAIVADSYWDYGVGHSSSSDLSTGLNISYARNVVIRTVYELQRDVSSDTLPPSDLDSHLRRVFTIQLLLRF